MNTDVLPERVNNLSNIMKIGDLPEEIKIYNLKVSNGDVYRVSGDILRKILNARSNFIQLKNGEGINKAFIVNWKLDFEETRKNFFRNYLKKI